MTALSNNSLRSCLALAAVACAVLMLAALGNPGLADASGAQGEALTISKGGPVAGSAKKQSKKRCGTKKRSSRKCLRTRTNRRQDSSRGPKLATVGVQDGMGADATGTQGAIDWALAQQPRSDYYWWCLKFVAHAFGSAAAGYNDPVAMMRARGVNGGEPPVGSLVLFGAVERNPYGHVGIYLGGGQMIHAVQTVRVSPVSSGRNYRGWQPAPGWWPGRAPSNPAPQFVAAGYKPAGSSTPAPKPTPAPAPAPAGTTCSSPAGAGGGIKGFHVQDVFLGGSWARTHVCDGTWYSKANKPGNAAYWYPNGLGVGVDCARAGAGYTVKWANGRVETWNTWFHVTDGKWFPSAAAQETSVNGFYGLSAC